MSTADGSLLVTALITDPTVTSIGRLPMRDSGSLHSGAAGARTGVADERYSRCLDGTWSFRLLDRPSDLTRELLVDPIDTADGGDWSSIAVPGTWTLQGPEVAGDGRRAFEPPHYTNVVMPFDEDPPAVPRDNPTGVYRTTVSTPRAWSGRRVVLRVGAAESVLQVFVDGEFVGGGTDSRLPSEFDLGPFLRPGRRCELALVVTKWSAQSWVEDQDQWWHGGIQRSVILYSTPKDHLAQVQLLAGLDDDRTTGTLSVEAVVAGPSTRAAGWTVEVAVETLERSRGGPTRRVVAHGPLHVPVWDPSTELTSLLSAMFVEPGVVRCSLEVSGVRPWSHEQPNRYRVLTTLRDPQGEVVHVHGATLGFRSVEVAENELRINGAPVLLHGVNLHEHDPDRGRAVGEQLTRRDLELMKAHNLNAVRAAHYPHDEHLSELCDELGLYLVDEANVESHGRQASLCHDPRFSATILERVQRMVQRDQCHPSIIMWSLGNESGYGAVHDAAAAWVRRVDPTRPLHYEGPLMHDLYADAPVTDVVCPMYPQIPEIVAWAESGRDTRRPLILCEYSHAMGNSNGSLSDYWDAIESTHGLQGGFIWEWLEHGLRRSDADGRVLGGPRGGSSWGYGGDFGDVPNDSNFVCDGLVSADRDPHPAMAEVHHIGRPARVAWQTAAGSGRATLRVSNHRWFTDLGDLRARWDLRADGEVVASGPLEVPRIEPRGSATLRSPLRPGHFATHAAASEWHLTVTWSLRRRTPWAPAGHEVGSDQLVVQPPVARSGSDRTGPPETGAPVPSTPSLAGANLFEVAGLEWRPTVFRALTDNDGLRHGWMRGLLGELRRWVDQQGLDRCEWVADTPRRRRRDGSQVETVSGLLTPAGADDGVEVRRRTREGPDGWTQWSTELRVPEALADPPRVGVEIVLPPSGAGESWEGLEFVADGPQECYPDRRSSARVARWTSSVTDSYVDYVVPQEHGHHTGLRWLALTRGTGRARIGLVVVAERAPRSRTDEPLWPGFAARHHSDAELWAASHTDELSDGPGRPTYLYLDAAQRGLGTGSCGPDALDRYRIRAGRHVVSAWFRTFDPRTEDPGSLAAQIRDARP